MWGYHRECSLALEPLIRSGITGEEYKDLLQTLQESTHNPGTLRWNTKRKGGVGCPEGHEGQESWGARKAQRLQPEPWTSERLIPKVWGGARERGFLMSCHRGGWCCPWRTVVQPISYYLDGGATGAQGGEGTLQRWHQECSGGAQTPGRHSSLSPPTLGPSSLFFAV